MKKSICLIAILSFLIFNPLLVQTETKDIEVRVKVLEDSLKVNPGDTKLLLRLGILYHNMGVKGDKEAVKKAEEVFKKLIRLEPENAEARCWYGSVLTMKGRDAKFPLNKIRYVMSGIKEMDKAVKMAPNNITVRMIRANNSLSLPNMFRRTEVAITDFEHLISMKEKNPEVFSEALLAEILLNLGRAYKKKGDLNKAREN